MIRIFGGELPLAGWPATGSGFRSRGVTAPRATPPATLPICARNPRRLISSGSLRFWSLFVFITGLAVLLVTRFDVLAHSIPLRNFFTISKNFFFGFKILRCFVWVVEVSG